MVARSVSRSQRAWYYYE